MKHRVAYIIVSIALALAFVVVVLGAYTRLTDSGLGCPDWPGCYGHWVLPQSVSGIEEAQKTFPTQMVEPGKAWKEMIHRYAAGSFGILIFVLFIQAIVKRCRKEIFPLGLCAFLVLLLFFQAALGMWTVTWKLLPLVVMGHLLGGLTILGTLRYIHLTIGSLAHREKSQSNPKYRRIWLIIGLLLVIFQIALGGWVSSNYSALACVGFPTCNGNYFPPMNLHEAFNLFSPIGLDYQGGKLDSTARITIQMVHRLNAILTAVYILILGGWVLVKEKTISIRRSAILAIVLVLIQFALGVILVTHLLPLSSAVAHNAVAALLLLTMVSWLFHHNHEF